MPTIRDVAYQCGMSISTVSKVFNGYSDISEATREQVFEAARAIGYRPNALARALKTKRTYNLGVLFVDENTSGLTHPFFSGMLNAFKDEAEKSGYDITFINHNIGGAPMTYLEHCQYRNVDGVCAACIDFYSDEMKALAASDIPCVTIDYSFDGCISVCSDNASGIHTLVDQAVAQGHQRIAYIHGQRNSDVTEIRLNAFLEAMREHDLALPEGYVAEGRYGDNATVYALVRRLLERADRPTCILLPDDFCCFGARDAIRSLGLKMPEDVSMLGYDGIELTQYLHPRLTTIRQDGPAMGVQAARKLIARLERAGGALSSVMVPVSLIPGETLAPAR